MELKKFKVGDRIKLINCSYYYDFHDKDIPESIIKHGCAPSTGNEGEIIDTIKDYYVVESKNGSNDSTILCFKEDSLKLISSRNQTFNIWN